MRHIAAPVQGLVRLVIAALACLAWSAFAADYPAPKEATWIAKDFKFHTGEVMPELRINYVTIGDPKNIPVLVLHGTTGSWHSMVTPAYAGVLFGPGQPLDANKYFIIIPDSIGHGKSSKPSDGMRASFPKYDYNDMVDAEYRLLNEGLGIHHLRLITGNSMGGMETWIWGSRYPDAMDALVPMASQPAAMSSRNWILRRLIVDSITNDAEWNNGNYTKQPRSAHAASVFFSFATSGGNQALYKAAPTRDKADALLDGRMKAPFTADANDTLYQWASSGDYDPSPGLEKIQAAVLAINSADDERNPPETGVMDRAIKRLHNGSYYLIPASDQTAGHGTTANAKWYAQRLGAFMGEVSRE
jgi:homoserine O-acetyltransferase/O-succinyltransferase